MTDLVERVARAICAATDTTPENALRGPYFDDPDSPYFFGKPQQQAPRWKLYVPAALAAITAMRLPDFSDWGTAREMLIALCEDAGAYDDTTAKVMALADWIEQFGPDALASGKEKP